MSFGKNPNTTNTTANTKGKVFPQWGKATSTFSLPSQVVGCLYANQVLRLHQVGKDFQRKIFKGYGSQISKAQKFWWHGWLKGCECLAF